MVNTEKDSIPSGNDENGWEDTERTLPGLSLL